MKKAIFLLMVSFLILSCARVGSPVGGDKDTLAPKMLWSNIDTARINVPTNIKELRIQFDEYILLKDINKQLIISPPIKRITKIVPSNLGSKYLLIKWEDTLKENTTYNFNFGNAIADLNEGNVLPYFNYAFSTGDKIDDLYISGTLTDAMGEKKVEGKDINYVVGLYQVKDSMDYRQKPYYVANVDPDGYFELNYLSPGKYKMVAFEDLNQNTIYDLGKEKVGFFKGDIEITNENISGKNIKIFPTVSIPKYKDYKEIPGGILVNYEGKPNSVKVETKNPSLKDFKVTHKEDSDSINIWFDAIASNIGIEKSESIKFGITTPIRTDSVTAYYKRNPKGEFSISSAVKEVAPQANFQFVGNMPFDKIDTKDWTMVSDSISQPFTAEVSKTNPFQINVLSDFKPGKKYQLTVPKETIASYYTSLPKSYRFDFEIGKPENYGAFTANLVNKPSQKYWLQLLDERGDVAYQQYTTDDSIKFTNLKPGNYTMRLLVDNNGNGKWDKADFQTQTYAEDIYLFRKNKDINPMTKINIRPLWEINEKWDINEEIQK